MKLMNIKDTYTEKPTKEILEELHKNLSLCVSMASGYVWKEKVTSFNKLIAEELLSFFKDELIEIKYPSLKNDYLRLSLEDSSICFHKNNLFSNNQELEKDDFLNQTLLYLEVNTLPDYLTTEDKLEISKSLKEEEFILINQYYNRQELNGNKYFLISIDNNKDKLMSILRKSSLYCISIKDYLNLLVNDKEKLNFEKDNLLINSYNNYILEIALYIAKRIKEELTKHE